jgi:hypothetical protein
MTLYFVLLPFVLILFGWACSSRFGARVDWVKMPIKKSRRAGTHYKIPIRGFSQSGRWLTNLLTAVGTPVVLEREKTNRYDPNAIAVYSVKRGRLHRFLGYVSRSRAKHLAVRMDSGCRFHGVVSRKYTQGHGQYQFTRLEAEVDLIEVAAK